MGQDNGEAMALVGVRLTAQLGHGFWTLALRFIVEVFGHILGRYALKRMGFDFFALVTNRLPGVIASASGSLEELNIMLSKMRIWKTNWRSSVE